jgi:hypothetical protein
MDNREIAIIGDMDQICESPFYDTGTYKRKSIFLSEFAWEKETIALGPVIKYSEEEALPHTCRVATYQVSGVNFPVSTYVIRPYPRLFCQCCKVPN